MAPGDVKKSWAQINKEHKDKRKQWREEKLMKKLKKQQVNEEKKNEDESKEKQQKLKKLSTVSVAVPGSILENAQSSELRTYLAGQIARAACIFQIDEVIIFDDYADEANARKAMVADNSNVKSIRRCCMQLGRILQYLECPQYLRKHFFPLHKDLQFAGLLNPLDAPHHLRQNDYFGFR